MEDKLFKLLFDKERWVYAIEKAVGKDMKHGALRKLCAPEERVRIAAEILMGTYVIERPWTAKIPKDTPGEFRVVFVNTPPNRVVLGLTNDLFFDTVGKDMVHPACKSYQKGIGCAKVVTAASRKIVELCGEGAETVGFKADLSKYFDSVPIEFIDATFDKIEFFMGKSCVVDMVRKYYHDNRYYDSEEKCEKEKFQSLKQGCAVGSFLADAVLYDLDVKMSRLDGYYIRYSDDILFIGRDYERGLEILNAELAKMGMRLNPKKLEMLDGRHWFKFLGFSIRGGDISLSATRIKTFQEEVGARTIELIKKGVKYETAARRVCSWLYYGDGNHSWATSVLKALNVKRDIDKLNGFVMDCLRAVKVGKRVKMADIGGLGWVKEGRLGCVDRGTGRKVRTMRGKTGDKLDGYKSLWCMRNNLMYGRDVYDTIVRTLI